MADAYERAGVSVRAGNEAIRRIAAHAARTAGPEVLGALGGFASGFALDTAGMDRPVLVSGADGVGTKLKIAFALDRHDTIGIDAVAMCVNDVVAQGARPLFFLDYLACGRVDPAKVERIVAGLADGCLAAGCALVGGETAELPDMLHPGEYDLAGFAVGVADAKHLVDGTGIEPGHAVIGLASSGLHANGFTLVRKALLAEGGHRLSDRLPGLEVPLGEELLRPTRIYAKSVLHLLRDHRVAGIAHITGGGFHENLPRILPPGTGVRIARGSWPVPPIFEVVQDATGLGEREAYGTFNMGIGMALVVPPAEVAAVIATATRLGESAYRIGEITAGDGAVVLDDEAA